MHRRMSMEILYTYKGLMSIRMNSEDIIFKKFSKTTETSQLNAQDN